MGIRRGWLEPHMIGAIYLAANLVHLQPGTSPFTTYSITTYHSLPKLPTMHMVMANFYLLALVSSFAFYPYFSPGTVIRRDMMYLVVSCSRTYTYPG